MASPAAGSPHRGAPAQDSGWSAAANPARGACASAPGHRVPRAPYPGHSPLPAPPGRSHPPSTPPAAGHLPPPALPRLCRRSAGCPGMPPEMHRCPSAPARRERFLRMPAKASPPAPGRQSPRRAAPASAPQHPPRAQRHAAPGRSAPLRRPGALHCAAPQRDGCCPAGAESPQLRVLSSCSWLPPPRHGSHGEASLACFQNRGHKIAHVIHGMIMLLFDLISLSAP